MGGVCGVAVESDAVRISYFRDGQRIEDSIDAEGAKWLLNGKLADCGPFDDVVLTGRDSDAVETLLASIDAGNTSTIRMVDESAALLAYARSVDQLANARALLVLDLGRYGTSAFTLDVAAGRVTRTSRRAAFSGEVLDDVVERLVMAKGILPPAHGADAEQEYRAFFRELKELITASAGVRAPGNGPMLLTREEFEEAITSSLLQTLAWASPEDPDAILLVGGQAQIPLVGALVEQEWDCPLVVPASPASVFVEGAALEALPIAPEVGLDDVLEEQYPGLFEESDGDRNDDDRNDDDRNDDDRNDADRNDDGTDVLEVRTLDDTEAATTPLRIVAPGPAAPVREREDASRPGHGTTADTDESSTQAAAPKPRRRLRWSVRDAAGMAAVAAVVVLVWAVVFVRGDTPPPPGIGIDPVDSPTSQVSVAEGIPTVVAPDPELPEPVVPDPELPGALPGDTGIVDQNETVDPESGQEQYAEVGFGSGTGLDVGN
ncbi:hypothetical protein CH267_04120 [Rhodococcus sp. 06-621-2]|nr:hypothetical protein [Rhodococcus sp. 06-621-2]OZC60143.1 hypothetical protein CH267_04120 [Rhodococcus sp. 06-621-2]